MLRRAFLLSSVAVALSSCAETGGYYPRPGAGFGFGNIPFGPTGEPLSLAPGQGQALGPGGGRVAILLPLSGGLSEVGQAMLQAAQLGFGAQGASALDVKDTGGTPGGAAAAARAAVTDRASIILGPLTAGETAAVAPIARSAGIAVLAFTNDPAVAQPGVWTLGITPVQQVRRLVAAAQAQGRTQFAALLPSNALGAAMGRALGQATNAAGLPPPEIRFHGPGMQSINVAVRGLSGYATRRAGIDAKIKADRDKGTQASLQEARALSRTAVPPPSFDALLMADTDSEALEEIAALLPYYYVDRSHVQIMGPSLWASPASGSGNMHGAWYAAPDPAARAGLVQDYTAKFGTAPPQVASLAFDAASMARVLGSDGDAAGALTRPAGFIGTDGWLALLPDGHVRRGLALFRVVSGGGEMIEPAPQSGRGAGT